MSSVPEGNPYAPPSAHVEDMATSGTGELAGRGARLGAAMIDVVILLVVFVVVAAVTPWSPFKSPASRMGMPHLIDSLVGMVIFALTQFYPLATRGQTIGKMLLGLRIVRTSGERASLGRLLGVRYGVGWLISIIPVIGQVYSFADSLFIFRESRKCLHDNIADTIVVKA